jgi:hypothetical protein
MASSFPAASAPTSMFVDSSCSIWRAPRSPESVSHPWECPSGVESPSP